MSIRSALQPLFAQTITSPTLRSTLRTLSNTTRRILAKPPSITWYHRPGDPHDYLLAQALPKLQDAYPDLRIIPRIVPPPTEDVAPQPDLLPAWGLNDTRTISPFYGLSPPDPNLPDPDTIQRARTLLLQHIDAPDYVQHALRIYQSLWAPSQHTPIPDSTPTTPKDHPTLTANAAHQRRRGNFQSASLLLGPTWYWSVTRIPLLQEHLALIGLPKTPNLITFDPTHARTYAEALPPNPTLQLTLSVRSPYSYIALERLSSFCEHNGTPIRLTPVLPMVMRGLSVPLVKRVAFLQDAAHQAHSQGIPFGKICDPLGPGIQNTLSIWHYAERDHLGLPFLREAMRGAWSQGMDLSQTKTLQDLCKRVHLPWSVAQAALQDSSWEEDIAQHRQNLLDLGLWGVPTMQLGEFAWWGQDRLPIVEAILKYAS